MFQANKQPVMCVYIHHSNVNAAQTDRLYFVLQPAQLLQGDIMVSQTTSWFQEKYVWQQCPVGGGSSVC